MEWEWERGPPENLAGFQPLPRQAPPRGTLPVPAWSGSGRAAAARGGGGGAAGRPLPAPEPVLS